MLTKADLDDHDAVEMARLVRAGEVTGSEVVEACLRRIEEVEPRLGAFVHVDGDAALQAARDREGRPLAGVPFAVKDVAGYPGMRWAMGSRMLDGNVAAEHSPYSEALDLAGLVTVGKTATSEFALLGSTESLLEGATVNPWRQGVSAAGSSGGAAAAVAAGVLPVAHASDGGGSVRVPASVCGLFGFKPSNGRTQPAAPPGGGFSDLVVDHCVSRSVRDSAALLRATERTGDDATYEPVGAVTEPQNGCLRIVTWRATLTGEQPDADVASALDDTAALCAELGHRVVEVSPPAVDGGAVSEAFFTLAGAAVEQVAAMMAPVLGRQVGADELEPFTLELLDWYRGLPELRRNAAPGTLAREAAAYRSVFDEADVVLTPTLAGSPWPLGYLAPTVGRAELVARTEQIVGYTPIHNIAGCPAMTVPLGWTADDLPMGSHFAAAPGADALLLRLAYQLEAAQPWWGRRPPRRVVAAH